MVATRLVATDDELRQILALQQANLRGSRPEDHERAHGFVTVEHSLEVLRAMHAVAPRPERSDAHSTASELAGCTANTAARKRATPVLACARSISAYTMSAHAECTARLER